MIDTGLAIVLWIPVSAVLFAVTGPARAVTLAYLLGWLLLPVASIPVPGFWDIDKTLATNAGVFLGTLLFRSNWLARYRFHLADLLLIVFCASGFMASMTNGLGARDGISRFGYLFLFYGVPYLGGRLFLRTREQLYDALHAVLAGASITTLAALWEWRMSPQLHVFVYGSFPHSFLQHARWGFFRPILCFEHALALGTFFAWTALVALAMWWQRTSWAPWGLPRSTLLVMILIGLLTSMSFGPWGMFAMGVGVLVLCRWWRSSGPLLIPVFLAASWMGTRYLALDDMSWLTSEVAKLSADRAQSLQYRINAERLLVDHARKRALFGWGTWGRNRVVDEHGFEPATDGLWVVIVGTSGLVGLISFYLWWCWPIFMNRAAPPPVRRDPVVQSLQASLGLLAVNFVFNGFVSPVLTLMCGALINVMRPVRGPLRRPTGVRRGTVTYARSSGL